MKKNDKVLVHLDAPYFAGHQGYFQRFSEDKKTIVLSTYKNGSYEFCVNVSDIKPTDGK